MLKNVNPVVSRLFLNQIKNAKQKGNENISQLANEFIKENSKACPMVMATVTPDDLVEDFLTKNPGT